MNNFLQLSFIMFYVETVIKSIFIGQQIWQTDMNLTRPYVLQLSETQVVGWRSYLYQTYLRKNLYSGLSLPAISGTLEQ